MGTAASFLFSCRNISKLNKNELEELESTTNFKTQQLQKWYKDFMQDCPDGHMTKEVFRKIYGQFFPAGNPSPFVDYIFNVFDSNKDGVVTFKEFITAIAVTTHGSVDDKLKWAFKLYDIDNDGYVSRFEMLDVVTAIYQLHGRFHASVRGRDAPDERVNQLLVKLDKAECSTMSSAERNNQKELFMRG
ncbi:neuronal calcium sensor 1-like [Limulus polyphemus]|uniref:Neuronal calcium sensor 1-like n=1 Tax=Limulus polyphemus TaxID=6850 RepID=A0ABM1S1U0_LIMPO|nr:neuronal calcium sensor 1-like [Limulus polyphemus]